MPTPPPSQQPSQPSQPGRFQQFLNLFFKSQPSQPPEFTIRRATTGDVAALLNLLDALTAFDRQFDTSLDPNYNRSEEGLAWLRATLEDKDALVLIATGAAPLGMLFGRLEGVEPWRDNGSVLAELEMLYIAEGARGTGIGRHLTNAFAQWAREHGAVRLWVRASAANAGALRFYHREAFEDYDVILERNL